MPSMAQFSTVAAPLLLLLSLLSIGAPRSAYVPNVTPGTGQTGAAVWSVPAASMAQVPVPMQPKPPVPAAASWDVSPWLHAAIGALVVGAVAGTRSKAVSVAAPDLEAVDLASRTASSAAHIATLAVEGAADIFLNNTRLSRPLQPLGNQVLVRMRRGEEKTGGGLFVPTAEAEKPKEGTVVAVGPGTLDEESGKTTPCMVAPGDLVLLSDFTGDNVDYNGQKHIFVDGDTILGTFANNEVTVSAFTPLGDRVMLEMAQKATETTTGIALALDEDTSEDSMGEAVAVGAGRYYNGDEIKPVGVSVGETVLYRERSGSEANIDGRRFVIVEEKNLLAKW